MVRRLSGAHARSRHASFIRSAARLGLLGASAMMLTGCYSFRGPSPVLTTTGVNPNAAYGPRKGPLFDRFAAAAYRAAGCGTAVGTTQRNCFQATTAGDQKRFMRSAYALIYADCDDFFALMGRRQRSSQIIRSSIGPLVTLLTGLITLKDFTNPDSQRDLLTVLTLGSAATQSGLDVYDDNFLFGSNNIDAVRELITRALGEHASKTLEKPNPDFEQATINILDNQDICRPPRIMKLTREAIANGSVVARTSTDTTPPPPKPNDDKTTPPADGGKTPPQPPAPAPQPEPPHDALETTSVSVPQ